MRKKAGSFKTNHPDFNLFYDKLSWTAMAVVAAYSANQLSKIGDNVAELNKNIAVVVEKIDDLDKRTDNLSTNFKEIDLRLKSIEIKGGQNGGS